MIDTSRPDIETEARTVTESERHELLAAKRRRVTLAVLTEASTPMGIDELAMAVADSEGDSPSQARERQVAISLHHSHLPKMAALGVLSYDPETQQVRS